MLEKGRKIGDYILAEKIGHGGFGDVWRAEKHTALSVSSFALKFFRPKETKQVDIAEVKRELEVWQRVSGLPNIISAIEADFFEDYIYIVSEYAEGGSMQKWLAANGGKAESVEQAVNIAIDILNGLDHLHRAGFIHRDIKPANILIRKGTFCLADFGVTREVKTHSITMHTAGTYQYMPPEAFSKKPIVSPETDIWAVGVILQELLTGRLPFPHDEIPSLMYSILNEEPEEMPSDIPTPLHEIVTRALQRQREERFSSALEMMAALKEWETTAIQVEEKPQIEEKPEEDIKAEKPEAVESNTVIPAETIVDENFALSEKNSLEGKEPEIEEKETERTEDKSPYETVIVSPSRKRNQDRLFTVGIIGGIIVAFGLFFLLFDSFSKTPFDYFEQGADCAARQDYDCAVENYTEAIEANPNFAEAYKHRAAAFYAQGNFEKAIEDYNRAIELKPNDANSFYGRGVAFYHRGDYDRAIENYTQAISLNPQDASFAYHRGLAYFDKGDFAKAIEEYTNVIKLNPKYAEAYNNRGNAFDEQGKNNQAIEDYTKAIGLKPDFALAYSNRGTSYARKGDYDRAVEDLNRALELNPNLSTTYFNRANIYYLKNDFERALADYNRVIELNPNNALAYSNRGVIHSKNGNYAQAIEDYSRAIELNPQDAQSFYSRALAFEKIGNSERAKADRQKFDELNKNQK